MGERLSELLARQAQAAAAAVSPAVFDYIEGGSGQEVSVADAAAAWHRYRLLPHVLRDVSVLDTSLTVLGDRLTTPLLIGPTAYHGVVHAGAEVETARGARAAGAHMVVATRSNALIAEVAEALDGPWWFQVYVLRDRRITAGLVQQAAQLGATALMLTGDAPILSRRRRGASLPPMSREQYLGTLAGFVRPDAHLEWDTAQDPTITLDTIAWLRELTGLPVLVKGVLRADDAVACVEAGAAGVVVSNHGGRQLDRAVSSAAALPAVAAAVGDRATVLVDGGVRSGIDVLVALALGARAVLLGRPVLWALACDGAEGVRQLLDGFRNDVREAFALAGIVSTADVSTDLLTETW